MLQGRRKHICPNTGFFVQLMKCSLYWHNALISLTIDLNDAGMRKSSSTSHTTRCPSPMLERKRGAVWASSTDCDNQVVILRCVMSDMATAVCNKCVVKLTSPGQSMSIQVSINGCVQTQRPLGL